MLAAAAVKDNIWVDGRTSGGEVLGDTWHGDKAKCRRCILKKALLPRLSGQFTGNTDLIKFDEGNGPSGRRRMGIGWTRRAGRNKFEFAKDLMERDSEEKFWKGNGNDVLSATEGNTGMPGMGRDM